MPEIRWYLIFKQWIRMAKGQAVKHGRHAAGALIS